MEELATVQAGMSLQTLTMDELGERAAAYKRDLDFTANRMMAGIVSLGEILVHVKERSEHGRYGNFENFVKSVGVKQRMAQYYMDAYRRFHDKPALLGQVGGMSKLIEVLALPSGSEEAFFAEHDVQGMGVRELRASVKTVTHPEQADAHEKKPKGMDKETREKIAHLEQERDEAVRRNERYKVLLDENREKYERVESELSSMRRQAESRGAEQQNVQQGQMNGAIFTAQVKRFIAECGEVPLMSNAFYGMKNDERRVFVDAINLLDNFVRSAQNALITTDMEGVAVK